MFRKIYTFLILLAVTYPAFSALLKPGYFPMHDDIQTMRLYEMNKCIYDLQIPCRWVPDMGYGYGYPQFNYYAPLPYYVMEVIHLAGFSIITSVKLGFLLSFFLAALGMYLLGKSVWKSRFAGFVGALFYTYFPYHSVDIYVRGAMGESWALAMFPFIFYSIYEIVVGENKKAVLYLAISVFGLATSHNVSTLMFFPFCVFWALYLLFQNKNHFVKKVKNIFYGVFWGGGLSAFFLLPAWFEKKYVHVETIVEGYFNYLAHFEGLKQLLFSSYWGYGSSELGNFDGLFLGIGAVWWMIPIFALIIFYFLKRKESSLVLFLLILGWASLFMIHSKSVFLWQHIEILKYIQFPWRFLGPALFLFSLAIGSIGILVNKRFIIFIYILLIGFYSGFFRPSDYLFISDDDKFTGESWVKQQTISIFDYLPVFALTPPSAMAPKTLVSSSPINVNKDISGTDWRKWQVDVLYDGTKITLPMFYFPGWTAIDNGKSLNVAYEETSGLISLVLDSGKHDLDLRFKNTPIRSISNIISLVSLILIPFFVKSIKKQYEQV